MNIDEVWKNCIEMWKYISENYGGSLENVKALKGEWLEDHGFKNIKNNCFFCEVAMGTCGNCPGRLVDKSFSCLREEYDWCEKPVEFYNKICELNAIRVLPEIICASAIQTENGTTVTGVRHCDCFAELKKMNFVLGRREYVQGFVTNKGRFMNREDAMKFAGLERKDLIGSVLTSEDLW